MPQDFHVLQCYSCESFQVDIIKKVPKWCCKMCGEKQSVIKVFAKGNGRECRLCVQELNEARIKSEDLSVKRRDFEASVSRIKPENDAGRVEGASKWTQFLENEGSSDSDDNNAGRSKRDESSKEKLKKQDNRSLNFTDDKKISEDKGVLKRHDRNETLKKKF
ncbi:hypothetical protein NQ318_020082 [Aromia moschata]|uniref:MRN complex-interacting protein N-terminal domain-containing protein n=1 Tax=Aromia moschata TaxID=1265417 RepID=A0AAV8Z923_9CUCU|nr:hypothetical protein NQ318_020082 [Aromia moschata]